MNYTLAESSLNGLSWGQRYQESRTIVLSIAELQLVCCTANSEYLTIGRAERTYIKRLMREFDPGHGRCCTKHNRIINRLGLWGAGVVWL